MSGNQEGRCEKRHARVDAGFEKIDTMNEVFREVVTEGSPHELELKRELLRGE